MANGRYGGFYMRITRLTATMLALSLPATGFAKTVSWPQPGMNAAHTGYNAKETVISGANVGSLVQKWSFQTNALINAAPVQVGNHLYVLSTDGNLHALNATTGALLWTFQADKNGAPATWGVAASAKIVYVNCQIDYDTSIYLGHGGLCALNAATGAELWTYAIYDEGSNNPVDSAPYNPPVLDHGKVFMGESDSGSFGHVGYTVALDAKTGAELWGTGNCNDNNFNDCNFVSTAPIAANGGKLYYNSGAATPPGGDQGAFCQRDEATGANGWCYYSKEVNIAPAIGGGKVVFIENQGGAAVVALSEATGAVAWTAPVGGASSPNPAPSIANGMAYVPVIGSNAQGSLYALSLKTGKVKWSYMCGGAAGCIASGVTVANGVVSAQCRGGVGEQCAFDAKTGAILRSDGGGGFTSAPPIVANGAELTVCGYNNLCRYAP
jgi:eukaryotic-like serine/threonine-protein kinase